MLWAREVKVPEYADGSVVPKTMSPLSSSCKDPRLSSALTWYFQTVYGRLEGPGALPFYCDSGKVGHFAINPAALAAGSPDALFKLFVALSMFQARRDVVIMRQQAQMSGGEARHLVSVGTIRRLAERSRCDRLGSAARFDVGCNVHKDGKLVDCSHLPGAPCHVKDATVLLKRMGDMGKLPTSAWLHAWKGGRLTKLLSEVQASEVDPQRRAELLVERFAGIHRVGVKLATLFVSALSTPALAPGLTPWFPAIDGNALVVVDTHVARAVDLLRGPGAAATYASRAGWIREQADWFDLQKYNSALPRFSPRMLQQALYSFCSKSNRRAAATDCPADAAPCGSCVPVLCPFASPA